MGTAQVCDVASAQVYIVRIAAISLRRTPEIRFAALTGEIPIADSVAGWQRRKRIGIRAVAITIPGRGPDRD